MVEKSTVVLYPLQNFGHHVKSKTFNPDYAWCSIHNINYTLHPHIKVLKKYRDKVREMKTQGCPLCKRDQKKGNKRRGRLSVLEIEKRITERSMN